MKLELTIFFLITILILKPNDKIIIKNNYAQQIKVKLLSLPTSAIEIYNKSNGSSWDIETEINIEIEVLIDAKTEKTVFFDNNNRFVGYAINMGYEYNTYEALIKKIDLRHCQYNLLLLNPIENHLETKSL